LISVIVGLFYWSRSTPTTNYSSIPNPSSTPSSSPSGQPQGAPQPITSANPVATIELEKGGIIKIQLLPSSAPSTVVNFTKHANTGDYDQLIFHRVEDWVVQGGDPKGNGTGGGNQPTELSQTPFKIGAVGIARGGDIKVSNDMQFFIVKKDSNFLNGQYTNFGQVIDGMDIVTKVAIGDKIRRIRVQ
jgi:peptidyl-prolyl cis-trans isomerase B (cyclophilin B)